MVEEAAQEEVRHKFPFLSLLIFFFFFASFSNQLVDVDVPRTLELEAEAAIPPLELEPLVAPGPQLLQHLFSHLFIFLLLTFQILQRSNW
jgi:hypothetical protein